MAKERPWHSTIKFSSTTPVYNCLGQAKPLRSTPLHAIALQSMHKPVSPMAQWTQLSQWSNGPWESA
eukprot:754604-Lingulodinium_polyedra.AAC.1